MAPEAKGLQEGRFPLQRQNEVFTTKKPGFSRETGSKIIAIFNEVRKIG
jgi:hypothetical protein